MRPRGLVTLSIVAALIAVLALPAIAGSAPAASRGVTARGVDDTLPGIETTATHITGTLDAVGADDDDVYRVHLEAGTQLTVVLTADPGTDFDVEMYRFNAENDRLGLVSRTSGREYPVAFAFTILESGAYSLDVHANSGSGAYTLDWSSHPLRPGEFLPGREMTGGDVTDTLDVATATAVYWRVRLEVGDAFVVTVTPVVGLEVSARLWGPGATTETVNGYDYEESPVFSVSVGGEQALRSVATTAGEYVLRVCALDGRGEYRMRSAISPAPERDRIPGVPLPASPATGSLSSLDHYDYYSFPLMRGERFWAVLWGISDETFAWTVETSATAEEAADFGGGGYYSMAASPGQLVLIGLSHVERVAQHDETLTVVVYASGEATYALEYSIRPAEPDDAYPGATATSSPLMGTLDCLDDSHDFLGLDLRAGEYVTFTVDVDTRDYFMARFFGPDSTDTGSQSWGAGMYDSLVSEDYSGFIAERTGRYTIDLYAMSGRGLYTLDWRVNTPRIVLGRLPGRVGVGRRLVVTGRMTPFHWESQPVTVDCSRLENGRWVRHRSVGATNTDPYGEVDEYVTPFRATVVLPLRGRWRVQAVHRDATDAVWRSPFSYVTVE